MDGMHDLGGKQGFGPVRYTQDAKAFHHQWEVRANSLYAHAVRRGLFNMDEYRHAIERMEPRHYLTASYYERSLTSLATLCVEKGLVTREELATPAMQTFIDDLVDTMHDADGAGLAAPQVYEAVQICAIEVRNNPRYPYKPNIPLTILVNPVLTPVGDEQFENYEGCLSVPNLRGRVKRYLHLHVTGWDRHGAPIDEVVHGLKAGTYQHEVDHLNGTIFVDRVTDPTSFATWTEFDRHHRSAFVDEMVALVARVGS